MAFILASFDQVFLVKTLFDISRFSRCEKKRKKPTKKVKKRSNSKKKVFDLLTIKENYYSTCPITLIDKEPTALGVTKKSALGKLIIHNQLIKDNQLGGCFSEYKGQSSSPRGRGNTPIQRVGTNVAYRLYLSYCFVLKVYFVDHWLIYSRLYCLLMSLVIMKYILSYLSLTKKSFKVVYLISQ